MRKSSALNAGVFLAQIRVATLCAVGLAAACHAQTLQGLGFIPSFGSESQALAVSADGQVVTGYSYNGSTRAFRWTRTGGMVSLGVLPNDTLSIGTALSGDGSIIVGYCGDDTGGTRHAFSWTNPAMIPTGGLPTATWSENMGISDDGTVTVGFSPSPTTGFHAFRRTTVDGAIDLGTLQSDLFSYGFGVSADGLVVVGLSYTSSSTVRGFRWTSAGGLQDIGTAAGRVCCIPQAASGDGSVIVGETGPTFGLNGNATGMVAFRWTAQTGPQDLGLLSGAAYSYGYAISRDGSTLAGYSGTNANNRAWLWTPSVGMVDLNLYLPSRGINTAGWVLSAARGLSADGRTIVGYGTHNGHTEAWIATLPPPCGSADFNCDNDVGTDADIDSFFACLSGTCPAAPCLSSADFNDDGDVGTDQDIDSFFRVLAGGPC